MEQQVLEMQHGKCKKNYPNVIVPQCGRGFFGIGIEYPRTAANIGTLWRSAHIMHADFMHRHAEKLEACSLVRV